MKLLKKSRTDKRLCGVCGGIGKYFGGDPIWCRLAFILCLFTPTAGPLVLGYIILAMVLSKESK
jgi:phage shock protein C